MQTGLESIRIIEIANGISASMAGKLLADLGAEVVKIEPPGGDPLRSEGPFPGGVADPEASGAYLYLNTNKRSLELDLTAPAGREALLPLVRRADLLIHDFPPAALASRGLHPEAFQATHPSLVLLSITPFGLQGPYRDYAATDLTLFHGGGWGWICPGRGTPAHFPPSKPFGQHALVQAGLHGAVAALAALRGARKTGVGEHIDFSIQDVVIFLLGRHFAVYPYTGRVDSRLSPPSYEPMTIYPCADGFIYLICPEQNQFERLVEVMGHPEWATDPRFGTRKGREVHAVELKARLSEWTVTMEAETLYHACQRNRVGAAPVLDYPALERQEHLRAREYFAAISHPRAGALTMPGAPYRLRHRLRARRSPAPLLGEANGERKRLFGDGASPSIPGGETSPNQHPGRGGTGSTGNGEAPLPLAGVRVLDLSWVWAGPHCTMMMAFLGAEVIKVESSLRTDLTRRTHLFAGDMEPGPNRNGYFNIINQGKLGIGVNLGTPEGVELVKELARHCDVMVSNFGTGVLEKLGLGADEMQRVNPRLICAMISAFGQTGPCRHYMGYGPLIAPLAGISAQTGYAEDGQPRDVGIAYGDPNGGVYTAVAILASLLAEENMGEARENGGDAGPDGNGGDKLEAGEPGRGQVIDLSMWESMICTGFEGWMNHALGNPPHAPMGNRSPVHAPHNLYPCGERVEGGGEGGEQDREQWVAIAVTSGAQWRGLCQAIGKPELEDDSRFRDAPSRKAHEDALDEILAAWCAQRERWEITRLLQAAGVPAFPSLDTPSLMEDPHIQERGLLTHWPHPEVGTRTLVGMPWRFTNRPNGLGKAAPLLGEDTDAVLERLLGMDEPRRADLRARGIIE